MNGGEGDALAGRNKSDLGQLKTELTREFTARVCLILGGGIALLFGLLKVLQTNRYRATLPEGDAE